MVLPLGPLILSLALSAAPAKGAPVDEGWAAFPKSKAGPKPALPPLRRPLPAVSSSPPPQRAKAAPRPAEIARPAAPPEPEEFNQVSMYGAQTLAPGQRGLGGQLGFPLLGVRAGVGVAEGLDLGVAFESFWGSMNEFRAHGRFRLLHGPRWTAAVVVEGGLALFTQRSNAEDHGARWLTGRRNYNAMPGLVLSYRGQTPRASRLFFDLRYHLALDTEPYHRDPLGGVPPAYQLGHNFPLRTGAELRLTARTSLLLVFGLDVHGRRDDAAFMPVCSVGLVSAI